MPDDGVVRVSPDGSLLAITAGVGPGSRVYLRRRGSLELELLAGAHGVWYTEFLPDGQWLLFGSVGRNFLQRAPVAGGAALKVVEATGVDDVGFDWDGADRIVYYTDDGLRRSSISGAEVETLTSTGGPDGRVSHCFPQVCHAAEAFSSPSSPASDPPTPAWRYSTPPRARCGHC